jgi:hypothetical protein
MAVVSSMTACMPYDPTRAAPPVTLRSPPSMTLDDQAEKFPDSNPSAKITSLDWVAVAVGAAVLVGVAAEVAVGVAVEVGVGVRARTGI